MKADEQLLFSSTDPGAPKVRPVGPLPEHLEPGDQRAGSPALRKALYEVAAKIPGVTVAGTYTDSLGRTGTVLHIGLWTMTVDTGNGQILAMTTPSVHRPVTTTVYVGRGWAAASSVPKVPGNAGAAGVMPIGGAAITGAS